MALEEFRHNYLRLCKDHHVEVQDIVTNQIGVSQKNPRKGGGFCLNMSTHSVTVKTCAILAKILATDRCFTEIKFNDCMIPEEGVKALSQGLATNMTCKKLDLKGNNVRGTAAEGLGRMLKQNTHMLSLCLEWNAMGMLDTSFSVFCDGLGSNTALQVLDLRNNQVSHDGAAELGAALKRNTTLKSVDLRWNNIGLLGGRGLLIALDINKTIVKIELAGNNTPADVLKSIETAVSHNGDRATLSQEFFSRQSMMSKEIQHLKKSKTNSMVDLMDKMERQESTMMKSTRNAAEKITQLREALEDRKESFNALAAKMSLLESELVLSESRVAELGTLLGHARDDQAEAGRQHQNSLKREREDRAINDGKLNKEIIDLTEKNMQMDNKLDELERRCRTQQEQVFELKESLAHTQAEAKMKASQFEEKLQFEKQKLKESHRDFEDSRQREVERIKKDAEETERGLKERIARLEDTRQQQDDELSRQKSAQAADRLHAEEQLSVTKQRLKNDEEARCRQLEEKVRLLQIGKDDLEKHAASQSANISELQSKNANLALENETVRRRMDDLNQEISGKNQETLTEVGKVRIELTQKIQKMEMERQSQADLYDKISHLEHELADLTTKHNTLQKEKEMEITSLSERLKSRESDVHQMLEADNQRSALLQNAIQSYVQKSPFASSR